MKPNTMKAKLRAGEYICGMTMNFASTTVVELAALAGFDYVLFDGEHGPLDPGTIEPMLLAAEARGITALARVPRNAPDLILQFLDTGLQGLMLPQINSAEDATAAVRAVKYHPLGDRGLGIVRANDWGRHRAPEYTDFANDQTLVIGLIENVKGVEQLDRILAVEGFDVVWVGASDLSQSMGLPGRRDHPEVDRLVEKVVRETRHAGKWAGTGVPNAAAIPRYRDMGVTCFSIQARLLLLDGGGAFLKEARSALGPRGA